MLLARSLTSLELWELPCFHGKLFVPKFRTNLLANSFPLYCCWFVLNRSLNYFSSKKFSRVVVYCSVIKVLNFLPFFSSNSFDIISKRFSFVKNFFKVFLFRFSLTGQLNHITTEPYCLSTIFYKFFYFFFTVSFQYNIWCFHRAPSTILPRQKYKNYRNFPVVFRIIPNGEGGI